MSASSIEMGIPNLLLEVFSSTCLQTIPTAVRLIIVGEDIVCLADGEERISCLPRQMNLRMLQRRWPDATAVDRDVLDECAVASEQNVCAVRVADLFNVDIVPITANATVGVVDQPLGLIAKLLKNERTAKEDVAGFRSALSGVVISQSASRLRGKQWNLCRSERRLVLGIFPRNRCG